MAIILGISNLPSDKLKNLNKIYNTGRYESQKRFYAYLLVLVRSEISK